MSKELTAQSEDTPFEVTIVAKPKHAIIYALVKKLGSIRRTAKEVGVCPMTISSWLNLKTMPKIGGKGTGPWSRKKLDRVALKLVQLTGRKIEEIFPTYVREKLSDIPEVIERNVSTKSMIAMGQHQIAKELNDRMTLPDPAESVFQTEREERIAEVLKTLPTRESNILKLRYGLEGTDPMTLEEVSKLVGVTRERIRQLEGRAIRMLQGPNRSQFLIGLC